MLVKEAYNSGISNQAIGAFDKSVTLIIEAHILNGNVAFVERIDNLFGLSNGNTRSV